MALPLVLVKKILCGKPFGPFVSVFWNSTNYQKIMNINYDDSYTFICVVKTPVWQNVSRSRILSLSNLLQCFKNVVYVKKLKIAFVKFALLLGCGQSHCTPRPLQNFPPPCTPLYIMQNRRKKMIYVVFWSLELANS